jgi:tRNA(fMet)-specific endonuclease VapC
MKYLLDTNTCIRFLNGRSPLVFERLSQVLESELTVCSIVKMELRYGALRSVNAERALAEQARFLDRFVSLPFDDSAHVMAARIRADLAHKGTPIGPYDLLIAAISLANDLILVTHNMREFSRVVGLKTEDWEEPVRS